jgi:hypothetical protein
MTAAIVDEAPPHRSSALGIVAFGVAVLAYLAFPAIVAVVERSGAVLGVSTALTMSTAVFGGIAIVALVAAVTKRGRGWAIAALVIAVANAYSPIHAAISDLVRAIFA